MFPWFSSSALRFNDIVTGMKARDAFAVDVWGPGPMEERHYLDLSWYGIHAVEMLYTLMGTGCEEVTRISGGDFQSGSDVVVGKWKDGRVGTRARSASDWGLREWSFSPAWKDPAESC